MGDALRDYFVRAERLGGIKAKVRLAELTEMPSMVAAVAEDTEALVARFGSALKEVIEELGGEGNVPTSRAESRWEACIRLLEQRERFIASRQATASRVTELAASLLRVARSSVWWVTEDGRALECVDAFDATAAAHSTGQRLSSSECLPYFEALRHERALAASNARDDPRTRCFLERYLVPHDLWAVLDTSIVSRGEMLGVVCCEDVTVRSWTKEERQYVLFFAQLVALGEELREGVYAR